MILVKDKRKLGLFLLLFIVLSSVLFNTNSDLVRAALIAPSLVSPTDDELISDDTPLLVWGAVPDAVKYQVQVDRYASFITTFLFANTTAPVTNFTIFFKLDQDTYFWRVRALDVSETWGPFSEIWSFSIDTTKPYISRPANIEYNEGETGNEIDWIPIDDFPRNYEVLFNDSVILSGQWNSTEWITVNVDDLPVGVYNYTIWIDDQSGQTNVDTVWVTVLPAVIPEFNRYFSMMLLPTIFLIPIVLRKRRIES
ncbi:MAG: hypothetical protein ACTSO5_13710 [Candidatus Heimdallarchaeaceae archaeon]